MNSLAICAKHLSKVYDIGARQGQHNTLRDHLTSSLKSLTRRKNSATANNKFWALKDVSFDVQRGEIIGFIGRNGAGKSTLLKLLSRITDPTDGEAKIYGRVGSLLEVGTGFHSELTGRENIYLSGAMLGMSKAEIDRKLDQIIDFAEVDKFVDTPVKRYSSGMYVRLAFAVAAHLETDILLVDEVLAVGDAAFQKKCLGQMDSVANKEGRTVLFVSHNMAMIENLCRRVLWLKDGRLAKDGAPNEVIGSYLSELSQMSSIPLIQRTDRQGHGDVRAVAVELRDSEGKLVGHPISGQHLVFRMRYRVDPGKIMRNCRVSVTIFKDEKPYFLLSTDLVDKTQLDLKGEGSVDLIVPELPLTAGTYDLNSYIQAGPDMQDWVDRAAEMTVIDGDFYGTGRNYPPDWRGSTVLVHHSWRQHQ
jgi:homopolymeric O-antigen transport system ATP-binding protein